MKNSNAQPIVEALTYHYGFAEQIKHLAADGQGATLRAVFVQLYADCDHDDFAAALAVRYIVPTLIEAPADLYRLTARDFVLKALEIEA